jgi:NAD(P)-dependent dehydrogenase (short-subunit alcohol dehydrogenase family)
MNDLTGQHVVITGGSRGIGAALGRVSCDSKLLTKDEVADAIVTACRRDRSHVVLPPRPRAQTTLAHLPQRIANLLTR